MSFRRIRFCSDGFDLQFTAGIGEGAGFITGSIVGHDAFYGDAEFFVLGNSGFQMGDGADGFFIWIDLAEGQARMIVNPTMDVFPAITTLSARAWS